MRFPTRSRIGSPPKDRGGRFFPAAAVAALLVAESLPASAGAQIEQAAALRGFDPVALSEGQRLEGEPAIASDHLGYRYHFASKKNRKKFEKDPERYRIQNQFCPVVPEERARPDLFAVHRGKVYIFATEDCVRQFQAEPERYIGETEKN